MPEKASQTNATAVTFEIGPDVSLTAEQAQRGLVYVRVPTSGVIPEPPQLYGPEIDGGQMHAALVEWNQAAAYMAAAEMDRLWGCRWRLRKRLMTCCRRKRLGARSLGMGSREAALSGEVDA